MFCLPQFIDDCATDIFNKLKKDNYYLDYDYDKTILSLVNLFADINALHPFREGNGRTQRHFIEELAKVNQIKLDLTQISSDDMISASCNSIAGDNRYLAKLFFACAEPVAVSKVNHL